MSMEEFLRNRGVSDREISYFNEQKIDCQAIFAMSEDDLKQLLPAYGDRVALKNFAKRSVSTGKQSLIERLKEKINRLKKTNDIASTSKKSQQTKKGKQTRVIEIGWLCMSKTEKRYKQVRARNGGGTRRVTIDKNSKCLEVLNIAKELFFPNGKSDKGCIRNFEVELVDYKSHIFDQNLTIQEMYQLAALPILRFYLATSKITDGSDEEEDSSQSSQRQNGTRKSSRMSQSSSEISSNENLSNENNQENNEQSSLFTSILNNEVEEATSYLEHFDHDLYLINDGEMESMNFPEDTVDAIQQIPKKKLILHRSKIFEELMVAFDRNYVDLKIVEMELILPNGESEKAFDNGGVLRDVLSEFWVQFYEKCTIGTTFKVPYIRHDYGEREWSVIAKIFVKGWYATEYIPIQLAPTFILKCLNQKVESDELIQNFLLFISDSEAELLKKASESFDNVEVDDLADFFSIYNTKWLPSEENLKQLITDVAHQELVQKPAFVAQCFSNEFKSLSNIVIHDIYAKLNPTAKNILLNMDLSDNELDSKQIEIFGYLKKFIRECDIKTRGNFLRFCSGSDIINQKIKISFNTLNGFARRPIARTCSGLLEIPVSYENFLEFRNDFNNILNSNIWVMDIV